MAKKERQQIPAGVRRALFDAADRRCSMCLRNVDIDGSTAHIGEMGHIAPSSPGGPRAEMDRPAEIDGVANLMLLCPACHRTIDKAPALWPGETLLAIKAEHEGWVAVERARPAPVKEVAEDPLGLGEVVEIGEDLFRVAGAPVEEWSADNATVVSRTFALGRDGRHVWLRRAESREPGPETLRWRAELAAEQDLLGEGLPGLPAVAAAALTPAELVLAVDVPSFTSMGDFYEGRGRAAETVKVLGAALEDVCAGLAALHAKGVAHGDLTLGSILTDRRGALALRDTGRAFAHSSDPSDRFAPADDVRALAELVHLIVTGRSPVPMVSASILNPAVPEGFARALARALSEDPAERGHISELGAQLRR
ncbi:hypothetical protein [Spirillospora sp. NBC_01491]|uniref:hypothetical protein n=1 Tax=Spirillospora sp. NBC_01491 TaxID=2976007 RepID=UPI002E315FE0|nr:hypothetical protein [Spirillospora sp. NBC_01491]